MKQLNIITHKSGVFDNYYAKPPYIDDSSPYSIAVLFFIDTIAYYGQYCFTTRKWTTLPSGEKSLTFLDKEVELWSYSPLYIEPAYKDEPSASSWISRMKPYKV